VSEWGGARVTVGISVQLLAVHTWALLMIIILYNCMYMYIFFVFYDILSKVHVLVGISAQVSPKTIIII